MSGSFKGVTVDLDAFLASHIPSIQGIVHSARSLVLDVLPHAVQTQEGNDLGFGTSGGYKGLVFVITPLKSAVKIGVVGGASLPDPHGLLRGTGKVHRHVRLESEADVKRPELRSLLESALQARLA